MIMHVGIANHGDKAIMMKKGTCVGTLRCMNSEHKINKIEIDQHEDDNMELENVNPGPDLTAEMTDVAQRAKFEEVWAKQTTDMPKSVDGGMKKQMWDMLYGFVDTLCSKKIGMVNDTVMDVDVQGAPPIQVRDRRWTPKELVTIKAEIDMMLGIHVIEPSTSDWANRLVMVPKKDGTIRTCVDFRGVNNLCKKDAYPSPNVQDTLERLKGAKWFSSFDAEKGYYQFDMTERAKDLTAFRSPLGLFRFTRMPFGLKNAGAVFNRTMNKALAGLLRKCCMVFVDDIVVYSETWEQHVKDVESVLKKMKESHIVTKDGIKPDPAKIEAVRAFERPETKKQMRSFLGLTGYLRRFIRNYSAIAAPLVATTTDKGQYRWRKQRVWGDQEIKAFEELKNKLTEDDVLAYPDYEKPFLVVCDASNRGAGAMLAQVDDNNAERPIAYASCTFNKAQKNYSATEKEGLAVVWATAHFRPYIHGVPAVVVTDHSALTWIMTVKDPPQRLARWVMSLMDYDLTFIHRKGKDNIVADALSRLKRKGEVTDEPEEDKDVEGDVVVINAVALEGDVTQAALDETFNKEIKEWRSCQEEEEQYGAMIKWLEDGIRPHDEDTWEWISMHEDRYVIQDGLLKYVEVVSRGKSCTVNTMVVVPRSKVFGLIAKCHESPLIGAHQGTKRLYPKIRERFWWPRMYTDIEEQVASCTICMSVGKATAKKSKIGGHGVGGNPFEYIAMDLLSLPVSYLGNKYAMVVMDYHSRYAMVAPLKTKEASEVAQTLLEKVIMVYGPPQKLLTDNGGEFKNKIMQQLCQSLKIKKKFTSPYNPQADGMVERFNRTLVRMLACYIEPNQRNWDLVLPMMVYAYNTTSCSAHGLSPFEIVFGRKANSSMDIDGVGDQESTGGYDKDIKDYVNFLTAEGKQKQRSNADKKRREPPQYKPGDVIWISSHVKLEDGARRKLRRLWKGPCVVIKMAGDVNVRVKEIASNHPNFVVHVDGTKPFKLAGKTANVHWAVEKIQPDKEVVSDTDDEDLNQDMDDQLWEVEAVTSHRFKEGRLQFKVKWAGWREETWEDEGKMDCYSMVEEYFLKKKSEGWGES